ncbi:MAG: hypothetical protein AAGK04_07390 [Planctomycetota bacterium]
MSRRPMAIASLVVAIISPALAGPLSPPAGAPTSTGKTLSELEPRIALSPDNTPGDANSVFKITELGSYYLTDNLRVPEGFAGIEIIQGATVDLNGFNIQRDTSITNGSAIRVNTNGNAAVRIMNGSVRLIPTGIEDGGDADRVTVESVSFATIDSHAIELDNEAMIKQCRFENVGGAAILVGANASIEDVVAQDCGSASQPAIETSGASRVSDTIVRSALGDALEVGPRSVVDRVQLNTPGGRGLLGGSRTAVRDSLFSATGAEGAELGQASQVSSCVFDNCTGVALLIETDLSSNPSGARIIDCSFFFNANGSIDGLRGADAGLSESLIRGCLVNGTGDGPQILLQGSNRVEACHFTFSSAIRTEGSRNSIIDCSFSSTDVVLNSSNNFVTKCMFSGTASLTDNGGGNFAPAPVTSPSGAWDNADR